MLQLKPFRAFLAAVLGFGYVYVGRIGVAVSFVSASFALVALFSLMRWVLNPTAIYVLASGLLILILVAIIHPVVIATKHRTVLRKPYNRWWFYVGWVVVFGVLSNTLLKNRASLLGYETFQVPASSMAPTLEAGDFIIADTWLYRSEKPQAGDIVVYEPYPNSEIKYVKRIVGVPGDEVELRGGRLFLNGRPAREKYLDPALRVGGIDFGPELLEGGEYFVLGDNRGNSRDSRYHGAVPLSRISGRVDSIWFSTANAERFPAKVGRVE